MAGPVYPPPINRQDMHVAIQRGHMTNEQADEIIRKDAEKRAEIKAAYDADYLKRSGGTLAPDHSHTKGPWTHYGSKTKDVTP